MTTYNTNIHMGEDSSSSANARSEMFDNGYETNWISIQVDNFEVVVFCKHLTQMAVIAKQLSFAVDEAIKERADANDKWATVDKMAGVYDIGGPWSQDNA